MVDPGDLFEAKKIAKQLKEDTYFYNECSQIAIEGFSKYYTEEKWKTKS